MICDFYMNCLMHMVCGADIIVLFKLVNKNISNIVSTNQKLT